MKEIISIFAIIWVAEDPDELISFIQPLMFNYRTLF